MRNSLDFDNNIFKSLLDKSTDLIIKEYGALDNQIGYHDCNFFLIWRPYKICEVWILGNLNRKLR